MLSNGTIGSSSRCSWETIRSCSTCSKSTTSTSWMPPKNTISPSSSGTGTDTWPRLTASYKSLIKCIRSRQKLSASGMNRPRRRLQSLWSRNLKISKVMLQGFQISLIKELPAWVKSSAKNSEEALLRRRQIQRRFSARKIQNRLTVTNLKRMSRRVI